MLRSRGTAQLTIIFAALAAGACVFSPNEPSLEMLTLAECNLLPNYADSTLSNMPPARLVRWRAFPLTIAIDTSEMPSGLRLPYRDAAMRGTAGWVDATDGRVRFQFVADPEAADVVLRFKPSDHVSALTVARFTGRLMENATIDINRPAEDADLIASGRAERLIHRVGRIAGHEVGHALGILLHSPDPVDLMANSAPTGGSGSGITDADLNTLLHAYCE